MFKSKYIPSLICKYDSPNPEMHNDMYDNLKENLTHLPKSIKAKLIYAASDWFNKTNEIGESYIISESTAPEHLKELAKYIESIEEVPKQDDVSFKWPEDIEKYSKGNCVDVALFVHYYCKKNDIKNKLARLTIAYGNNERSTFLNHQSHIICACYENNSWFIVQNSGLGDDLSALFTINSKSLEKTIEKFASIYMPRLSEYLISEKPDMVIDKIYYNVLSDKELESFDKKYYGEKRPDKQKVFSSLFSKSSSHKPHA